MIDFSDRSWVPFVRAVLHGEL
ncbi:MULTISPECIES: hypothetical protein [unclassified Streptomyces]|nr:hypothetical protein [Streptomyces sp. CoH27]